MENNEYNQKKQQLEETYYQEKQAIQREHQETDERVAQFRRETAQLIDKVFYFTKNDHWNKQSFSTKMQVRDDTIRQAGRLYSDYLDEKQQMLAKNYTKEIEQLEETYREQKEES